MISPSSSAVVNRPLKKSSAAIERLLVLTLAPSASTAAGKSAAGSLFPIASVMALITAADAPIAPASPQPLTPSGLLGHSVVVWFNLNDGRSSARGMV